MNNLSNSHELNFSLISLAGGMSPEFTALLVGLGTYTAAFIAEVVRAGILAVEPLRQTFEMTFLTAVEWFIALLAAALGLVIASLLWRLPLFQEWESPSEDEIPPLER